MKDEVVNLKPQELEKQKGPAPFRRANTITKSNIDFNHTDGLDNETD
jgi:hypothetical protein